MTARILVTGAAGVVGTEVCRLLEGAGHSVLKVARRPPPSPAWVAWRMGAEPPPDSLLRQPWDVVIHAAASTRWTLTREEATDANVLPVRAVLDLIGPGTRLVHVSTAYAGEATAADDEFDGYRNGYEWSKARSEELVLGHGVGSVRIVRPPLIVGRRDTGAIARFSGPYTMLQALVAGLAAVVVGDPDGYAEIAPVDLVAETIVAAAFAPPDGRAIEVIAAGERCLRLREMLGHILATINGWRASQGIGPVPTPPVLSLDKWHRFYLPLAHEYLSPVQAEAVQLLGMFEAYTSMPAPFSPTVPVEDPAAVLTAAVEYWIATKPRLARRIPQAWSMVPVNRRTQAADH